MLYWGIGLIGALLAVTTYDSVQSTGPAGLDSKLNKMMTRQGFWYEEDATAQTEQDMLETSPVISFSESFQDCSYGDVLGHIEMEFTRIDCDIVYVQDKADAAVRSRREPECVYLYWSEDGDGLNASYINLYADEYILPDYDEMEEIGEASSDRYLHLWIEAGGEQLQMDILGVYYSDDMETDDGILRAMVETDFIPEDAAQSDTAMLEYVQECLKYMPGEYTYDKMVVIDNLQFGNMDHKRIIVAVNVPD